MILGCHNVIMYNHSTFVLGYLLLQGYDVTGKMYVRRVEGLLVGMILCMIIFYKNQKEQTIIAGHSLICSGSLMSIPQEADGISGWH
mgnify:CR=1 FL=1